MKWFCIHDWSEWSGVTTPFGAGIQQHRFCNRCEKIKTRRLGYLSGARAKTINDAIALLKLKKKDNVVKFKD